MKIFAIDTTSIRTTMAIVDGGTLRARYDQEHLHPPGDALLACLDDMCGAAGIGDLSTMDVFACCIGPGSFTGLRVGVAVAKTLAFAHQRPVFGADNAEVVARRAQSARLIEDGAPFMAVYRDRSIALFAARFALEAGELRRLGGFRWGETWRDLEPMHEGGPIICSASFDGLPKNAIIVDHGASAAEIIAGVAAREFERGRVPDFASVQPLYIKPFSVGGKAPSPGAVA